MSDRGRLLVNQTVTNDRPLQSDPIDRNRAGGMDGV